MSPDSARKVDHILRVVGNTSSRSMRRIPPCLITAGRRWRRKDLHRRMETLALKPRQPIPNVTAVALRVHNGDVVVANLVVVDTDQTRWEFSRTIAVAAEQPRPEVCFLGLPTRIAEIRLTYQSKEPQSPNRPRLFVDVGVCNVRESGKQAPVLPASRPRRP